jgi:predicted GIY-YIG superfamily endonuclease
MADNKYSNGKIYKIVDNTSEKVYIGSTCRSLKQRLTTHELDFRRYMNGKSYFKVFITATITKASNHTRREEKQVNTVFNAIRGVQYLVNQHDMIHGRT